MIDDAPRPPENVRVVNKETGAETPISLSYTGRDDEGLAVWEVADLPEWFSWGDHTISIAILPARTKIALPELIVDLDRPEPPPITPQLEADIKAGEDRMAWQDKWLRRIKYPLIVFSLAGLLPMLYFPEWRYSAAACFTTIIVAFVVAFPFMTTGWPYSEIPRALRAHMRKASRLDWEAQQMRGDNG